MDTYILHLIGPGRDDSPAIIAGERSALLRLRQAIDQALEHGIGMAELSSSDYEPYELLVVAPADMWNVCTAYANEVNPVRSLRETISMTQLAELSLSRQRSRAGDHIASAIPLNGDLERSLVPELSRERGYRRRHDD